MKIILGDQLRDQPVHPERFERALTIARQNLRTARQPDGKRSHQEHQGILGRELQRLGNYLRINGELREAETLLREAVDLWTSMGRQRAEMLASIKLAAVIADSGDLPQAERLFALLLERHRPFGVPEMIGRSGFNLDKGDGITVFCNNIDFSQSGAKIGFQYFITTLF